MSNTFFVFIVGIYLNASGLIENLDPYQIGLFAGIAITSVIIDILRVANALTR